jgi:protease I
MKLNDKIFIIPRDAGESFEVIYATHRLGETGYEKVITLPAIRHFYSC